MRIGASYYPELIDEAEWRRDLETARGLGLSVLRCGEFAWSAFEREDGAWTPEWARRFCDLAHELGYHVIWCTPSATPPPRLLRRWPDLHAVDAQGHVMPAGIRRHYSPAHAPYRERCAEIAGRIARELAGHPAVVGWQVDNEIAGDGFTCWGDLNLGPFHAWLRERYGGLEELNRAWDTMVWSQVYTAWEEIPIPRAPFGNHAPALKLAYRRYLSDAWLAFHRAQYDALKAGGARTVTTNVFNYTWHVPADLWRWREHLDAIGISHYLEDPVTSGFQLDLLRGLAGDRPLWVLEQAPGVLTAEDLADDGRARREAHLRRCAEAGAEYACYWHLRAHAAGCEQEHGAVLDHAGRAGRIARGIRDAIAALGDVPERRPDGVALVASFDQHLAGETHAGRRLRHLHELAAGPYAALHARGLAPRIVPGPAGAGASDLLLAPCCPLAEPGAVDALLAHCRAGGRAVIDAAYATWDEDNNVLRRPPLWFLPPPPALELARLGREERATATIDDVAATGGGFVAAVDDPAGAELIGTLRAGAHEGPAALRWQLGSGSLVVALTRLDAAGWGALLDRLTAAVEPAGR